MGVKINTNTSRITSWETIQPMGKTATIQPTKSHRNAKGQTNPTIPISPTNPAAILGQAPPFCGPRNRKTIPTRDRRSKRAPNGFRVCLVG